MPTLAEEMEIKKRVRPTLLRVRGELARQKRQLQEQVEKLKEHETLEVEAQKRAIKLVGDLLERSDFHLRNL